MYKNEEIEYKGRVSDSHLNQIYIGLHDSPLIEESTKKLIENPSDNDAT